MTGNIKSWVLVTGASSGFGVEFARQYAEQGRSLILAARTLSKLESLATELRQSFNVDVIVEQVDLSSIEAVTALHQRLRERGVVVDVLINNAGHGLQGPFLDEALDHSLAMIDLDIRSLTAMTRLFGEDMRARKKEAS
ncbi:short-subunit dehydrogenase [Xanthomonas arboricola]|nr:short-subunit dehydrogenase [Xanthomonas euroxanthea]